MPPLCGLNVVVGQLQHSSVDLHGSHLAAAECDLLVFFAQPDICTALSDCMPVFKLKVGGGPKWFSPLALLLFGCMHE